MNDPLGGAARTIARLSRVLERACDDLSLPQYRVLVMVAEGGERASQLARRLALAKPTITAAVDFLVGRGFIERSEVEADRRASRLTVTAAGRRALRVAEESMAAALAPVFDHLADPAEAVAALAALGDALDHVVAERLAARVSH